MTTNDLFGVVKQFILFGDSLARHTLADMYAENADENFANWLRGNEHYQKCVVMFGEIDGRSDITAPNVIQFDCQTSLDIAQNFLANNAAFFTTYQEADQYYQREIGMDEHLDDFDNDFDHADDETEEDE